MDEMDEMDGGCPPSAPRGEEEVGPVRRVRRVRPVRPAPPLPAPGAQDRGRGRLGEDIWQARWAATLLPRSVEAHGAHVGVSPHPPLSSSELRNTKRPMPGASPGVFPRKAIQLSKSECRPGHGCVPTKASRAAGTHTERTVQATGRWRAAIIRSRASRAWPRPAGGPPREPPTPAPRRAPSGSFSRSRHPSRPGAAPKGPFVQGTSIGLPSAPPWPTAAWPRPAASRGDDSDTPPPSSRQRATQLLRGALAPQFANRKSQIRNQSKCSACTVTPPSWRQDRGHPAPDCVGRMPTRLPARMLALRLERQACSPGPVATSAERLRITNRK